MATPTAGADDELLTLKVPLCMESGGSGMAERYCLVEMPI
jgi:hypothetical protein